MPLPYATFDRFSNLSRGCIYDTVSGHYRPVLDTDYVVAAGGGTGITNTKPYAANNLPAETINPLAVKLGGNSAGAFNEGLFAELDPQIEAYCESAFDPREFEIYTGANDGYVTVGTGMAEVKMGSTILAYSTLRTHDFVPYVPGQGVTARFSTCFDTGVANSLQLVGPYHAEDGYAVGYNGTGFGVVHRYGRKLEIQKLSFTTDSDTAGDVTVTLNGTPNTVRLGAEGTIMADARNVATGASYAENGPLGSEFEWQGYQISGDTYFMRTTHGPLTGSIGFNAGSTNAVAAFTQIQSGENGSQDWTYQSGFSFDTLDGNGPSSMTLDPQKFNEYQIKFGWPGLPTKFSVINEQCQEIIPFHITPWSNLNVRPKLNDPRFPISWAVASAGSTTEMKIKGASAYGAIEGRSPLKHKQFSVINEQAANTTEAPIVAVQCNRFNLQNNVVNRRRMFVKEVDLTNESSTKAAIVRVYIGKPRDLHNSNFAVPKILHSIELVDKASTAIVEEYRGDLDLIASEGIAPSSTAALPLEKFIGPKDVLIITVQTSSSTADCIVSINGFEDV